MCKWFENKFFFTAFLTSLFKSFTAKFGFLLDCDNVERTFVETLSKCLHDHYMIYLRCDKLIKQLHSENLDEKTRRKTRKRVDRCLIQLKDQGDYCVITQDHLDEVHKKNKTRRNCKQVKKNFLLSHSLSISRQGNFASLLMKTNAHWPQWLLWLNHEKRGKTAWQRQKNPPHYRNFVYYMVLIC